MEASKPQTLTDAVRSLVETNIPWLFVPGTLLLSVAGSALYALIVKPLGTEPSAHGLTIVLFGSLFGIVVIAWAIAKWFKRKLLRSSFVGGTATRKKRKAIIFTIGFQKETIVKAIKEQSPEFLGFLHSDESKGVVDDAITTAARTSEKNKIKLREVRPDDFSQVREATVSLVREMMRDWNITQSETVIDLTGGKVPMSIGAFRAAEELGIDTQYVTSEYDKTNRAIAPKEIILVTDYAPTSNEA
jgi:hypothetical protein